MDSPSGVFTVVLVSKRSALSLNSLVASRMMAQGQKTAQFGQSQRFGFIFRRIGEGAESMDVFAREKVGVFSENLAQAHIFLEARADLVPLFS